jgi:hypothetical protein
MSYLHCTYIIFLHIRSLSDTQKIPYIVLCNREVSNGTFPNDVLFVNLELPRLPLHLRKSNEHAMTCPPNYKIMGLWQPQCPCSTEPIRIIRLGARTVNDQTQIVPPNHRERLDISWSWPILGSKMNQVFAYHSRH